MHRAGHVGAALLAYAPLGAVAAVASVPVAVGGCAVAVGLAMAPDYDQRVPVVEHRGLTHTVWFALAVATVTGAGGALLGARTGPLAAVALGGFGAVVGAVTIVSHVVADALTPMGVTPFAPVSDRHYSFEVATASNPVANYALLAGGVVATAAAAVLARTVRGALPAF